MVQNYVMAKDAKEALNLLAGYEGRGRIIAGGTDLVLDLQSGKYQAECLVDITVDYRITCNNGNQRTLINP